MGGTEIWDPYISATYWKMVIASLWINMCNLTLHHRVCLASLSLQCFLCSQMVYPAEYVGIDDRGFHNSCFR